MRAPRPRPLLATHVITRLIVGGAQENTISTVLGLQGDPRLAVKLLSGPTFGSEGSLENTFQEHPKLLTIIPSLTRPIRPLADLRGLTQLRREFRKNPPAIVHTHSGKAGILGRWAARLEHVPIIIHGIHGPSFGHWQGPVANAIFRNVERRAGRVTTHFVAVANAMIEQYLNAGIGSREQYTRIFSGFPLDPYLQAQNSAEVRARFGIRSEDIVIGKIARLFELKGHDDLFLLAPELLKRNPRVKFLLVGGGPWEERFKKLAAQLRVADHFIFTGLVPPAQIPSLTGIMDMLVHLSLREGLPRALPQAMAAGKPVVAYDCDGAGEVCRNDKTGFLIKPRHREELLNGLAALAGNPELRARMGASAREFVRERFPVEKMVSDTRVLYWQLLERHGLVPNSG
jgi:glycosyltransferase involved in cell wall biosynthesis